jgi:monoamine oxidase
MEQVDVVIVGAGLAGLAAARDLRAAGLTIVVLEAHQQVGGRVLNHTFSNGVVVELGGQWVGPTQDRVLALVADLGTELFPTYEAGLGLIALDGLARRFDEDNFGLPEDASRDVASAMEALDDMARDVPLSEPWSAEQADRWDRQTVDTWIDANLMTAKGKRFMRAMVPGVFAAEAWDMSLLHFLFYVHSGGLIDRILSTEGGAQESRVVGGSQVLALRLADRLGDAVRLDVPVRAISRSHGQVETAAEEQRFTSRRVVVTAPPAIASRIHYSPALPPLRDQLTQKIPMGYVIKCLAMYERPFWRDGGLSGFAFDPDGPLLEVHDNSPHGGRVGILVGFAEGRQGRLLGRLEREDRRAIVAKTLSRFFGPQAARPIDYAEKDWAADEWIRGCYAGHLAPGVWTQYGEGLREPCDLIHWAGSETSDTWNGYMDGAVRSGERVAAEVIRALS